METSDTLTSPPYVFIGHSAGCAVALEYISTAAHQPFSGIIFLAPLLRSRFYRMSHLGYTCFHGFKASSRRFFRKSSHDDEFHKRLLEDPLQPSNFPMQWAGAYFRWFDNIKNMPQRKLPLAIIQGTGDRVVDWKYNLRWFKRKVEGVRIIKIPGCRHQLLNESSEYRKRCCQWIRALLSEPSIESHDVFINE